MSTQSVTDKILHDAHTAAEAIRRKYEEQIQRIRNESKQHLEARRKEIEAQAEKVKKTEIIRAIAQKKLAFNKQLIDKKQQLIDTIIDEALTTFHDHKEYGNFLKALIDTSTLNSGKLHMNSTDQKKYGSMLEKHMKKEKRDYTIAKDDTLIGGVTITYKTTTHHGSLDLIKELLHEELTIAVSQQFL